MATWANPEAVEHYIRNNPAQVAQFIASKLPQEQLDALESQYVNKAERIEWLESTLAEGATYGMPQQWQDYMTAQIAKLQG